MKLINSIRKLCTPAYVYLVISVIAIVAMMFQNAEIATNIVWVNSRATFPALLEYSWPRVSTSPSGPSS